MSASLRVCTAWAWSRAVASRWRAAQGPPAAVPRLSVAVARVIGGAGHRGRRPRRAARPRGRRGRRSRRGRGRVKALEPRCAAAARESV